MVVLSPSLTKLFRIARDVRETKERALVQRALAAAVWRRLLQSFFCASVPPPRGLRVRVRLPRCPWNIKSMLETELARKVLPPEQLHAIAAAALESLGRNVQATVKGTAAIHLATPRTIRDALAPPGDIDIAIRGLENPADVLSAAMRVKTCVAPLFSSPAVHFVLRSNGCSPDFSRRRVADQRVIWEKGATLPLLCWLHPRPIYGHRCEQVWLARVGLSICYGSAPLLLPLIDLAVETEPPRQTDRREEVAAVVEGVRAYTLLSCVHANLRMLFDETGAKPWEAKKAHKRMRASVVLAIWMWRGSPEVLSEVGDWLEATLRLEADPRAKLRYLLHDPPPSTVRRPRGLDGQEWRDSALRALVVAIRCMTRRFHKTSDTPSQAGLDMHIGMLKIAVCSWREAVALIRQDDK
jgi:hypothetical protein